MMFPCFPCVFFQQIPGFPIFQWDPLSLAHQFEVTQRCLRSHRLQISGAWTSLDAKCWNQRKSW